MTSFSKCFLSKISLLSCLLLCLIGRIYDLHQCHDSTFDLKQEAGFKYSGNKWRHYITPYSEWYTFYLWDSKQDVWFFINNIFATVAGGKYTLKKSYPSYYFPNADGPRAELDTFDYFEAEKTHLDVSLWNSDNEAFSKMKQVDSFPHQNRVAFQVSGLTADSLTRWNLTFTQIPSQIGSSVCISKKAKINMMHPDFSWLALMPAAHVEGTLEHDGVFYDIDGFGSMEHVYGDMVQPALSWTYSFFHDGDNFMMLALGRKHMQRAANIFVVETSGRRFSFNTGGGAAAGSSLPFQVEYQFKDGYDYPHHVTVRGTTENDEEVIAEITAIGDSFASDGKRGAAELRAHFNISICEKDVCHQVTQDAHGWFEYYSFSMLDRKYLPIFHQMPYRIALGFFANVLRVFEGVLVLGVALILRHSTSRSTPKGCKYLKQSMMKRDCQSDIDQHETRRKFIFSWEKKIGLDDMLKVDSSDAVGEIQEAALL